MSTATIISLCSLVVTVLGVAVAVITAIRRGAASEGRVAARLDNLVSVGDFERRLGMLATQLVVIDGFRERLEHVERKSSTTAQQESIQRANRSLYSDVQDLRNQLRVDVSALYDRLTDLRDRTQQNAHLDRESSHSTIVRLEGDVSRLSEGIAGLVDGRHAVDTALAALTSEVSVLRQLQQTLEALQHDLGALRERVTRLEVLPTRCSRKEAES